MENITPCLWFDKNGEEAVDFYTSIFPNSEITQVTHYPEGTEHMPPGSVLTISFTLTGNPMLALNGGPAFTFSEGVSLMVDCDSQEEIDHYWERLGEGGSEMACGWLKDKYGLAWQIVPAKFLGMIDSSDPETAARVLAAMNTMVKFDLAGIEAAYNQTE